MMRYGFESFLAISMTSEVFTNVYGELVLFFRGRKSSLTVLEATMILLE